MRLQIEPRRVAARPGSPASFGVVVTNGSSVISGYALRVLGVDPAWVAVEDPSPRLFPGESVSVGLTVTLPEGVPAGERRVAVQVRDLTDEAAIAVEELVLDVPAAPRAAVRLDPVAVTTGQKAGYTAVVHNEGNTVQHLELVARDPEARTTFAFRPAYLSLPPGRSESVAIQARARRPLAGDPRLRPFELRLSGPAAPGPDAPPAAVGVFIQKPWFSRGLLGLIGLLAAISIFAVVITAALGSVVHRSAADRNLAIQVAQARNASATTGTSTLSGTVVELSTGTPLADVSVEAFGADPSTPLLTTATAKDGTFSLARLPAGDYTVRVRGAGFADAWYPSAASQQGATPVRVTAGQTVSGLTVVVGGAPAELSGTVLGTDVGGAVLTVQMPLDVPPLAGTVTPQPGEATATGPQGAVVRTVPIGADGTFDVTGLPSPALYDLVVTKAGFAGAVQRIDVAAGEDRTGIELSLLVGDGSIAGTVAGISGPVGGASITATNGQTRVQTVSLTQDQVGSFVLRGLPTPGTYTVVVSADGYAPATLNLTLTQAQALTGVSVVLGRDQASLGGTVSVPGGDPSGVSVTVSDGSVTAQTVTSSSPAGAWQVTGLHLPSTYTVTFARTDLQSQVLSVGLDAYGAVTSGAPSATRVDATLRAGTARLTGHVTQTSPTGSPVPVGNVTVTVSSGTAQLVVWTASTPSSDVGHYEVPGLAPGTYTVTFSRTGTKATSSIVQLGAGDVRDLSPTLIAPAQISGTVTQGGAPLPGYTVVLFTAATYGTGAAPVATATTAADGTYTLPDLDAPQSYILEVRAGPTSTALYASAPITLSASQQYTLDPAVPLG